MGRECGPVNPKISAGVTFQQTLVGNHGRTFKGIGDLIALDRDRRPL